MIVWSVGLIPVQEWIGEARRSRDLRIGSALLSWLMARALQTLTKSGAQVFVPAAGVDDLAAKQPVELLHVNYSIPNRASGRLGGPESMQGAINSRWATLREAVGPSARPRKFAPHGSCRHQ